MPTIDPELVEILACPETRQRVHLASESDLAAVNAKVKSGALRNRGGGKVEQEIAAGLVREDGKILYPIEDGIPVMLIEESIEL
jgi:uncharacterized protein YbaR (Trm112 family)